MLILKFELASESITDRLIHGHQAGITHHASEDLGDTRSARFCSLGFRLGVETRQLSESVLEFQSC